MTVAAGRRRLLGSGLLAAVLLGVAPVAQAAAAPPAPIYAFGTGLLGDGYTHSSATPQRVSALLNKRIIQVSSYSENGRRPDHTLALTEGGTIYSWGRNGHLQLGYGGGSSFAPKQVPTANSGLNSRVIAVAAGYQFSMALTAKGQVLTWGLASRLGDGSTVDRAKPTVITGLQGQYGSVISAGQTHAEVVTSAGQVWGWGTGGDGELGTGATADSAVPVSAELPPGFTAAEVVVGGSIVPDVGPVNFTLARSVDGQLLAWGANNFGQLGTGSTGPDQTRPVPVKVPADAGDILSLAAGGQNGGFITVDGRVVTWGQNIFGNLGNGTTTRDATPSYVTLPANATRVIRLSMSDYNTLISTDTSQVYGWGSNESWATGALGTTAVTHSSVPIPIDLPSANTYVELDAGGPTSYVVLRVP